MPPNGNYHISYDCQRKNWLNRRCRLPKQGWIRLFAIFGRIVTIAAAKENQLMIRRLVFALIVSLSQIAWADSLLRQAVDLNPGWKFIRQDVIDAQNPTFNDSAWGSISLPHTWNISDGESAKMYRGVGWYRRHLDLSGEN